MQRRGRQVPDDERRQRTAAQRVPASAVEHGVVPHAAAGNQALQRRIQRGDLPPALLTGARPALGNQALQRLLAAPAAPTIQRRGGSGGGSADAGADGGSGGGRSLADIERNYRDMVRSARRQGYPVAADNLEYWLDGHGGERRLSVAWLRGFDVVVAAEETNQERFEDQLKAQAARLTDGGSGAFHDYWDRALTASPLTELFYASGTSQLRSTGTFALRRAGRTVTITGSVHHRWHDPYNWNAGQGAYIPGFGAISDDDALFLKANGIGADYDLVSEWTQTVTGTVDIGYVYDTIDLQWQGP